MSRTEFLIRQFLFLLVSYLVVLGLHYLFRMIPWDLAPILLQLFLFCIGLILFKQPKIFPYIYWLTLALLGQSFADTIIHINLLLVPILLFILWGMYRILSIEVKWGCLILQINSVIGRNFFLLCTLLVFFGYFGAAGFLTNYPPSILLSWLSWMMVPLCLNLFYKKILRP